MPLQRLEETLKKLLACYEILTEEGFLAPIEFMIKKLQEIEILMFGNKWMFGFKCIFYIIAALKNICKVFLVHPYCSINEFYLVSLKIFLIRLISQTKSALVK